DGIRDYKVTGVQTCALPISVHLRERFLTAHTENGVTEPDEHGDGRNGRPDGSLQPPKGIVREREVARHGRRWQRPAAPENREERSEERRVGKGWRAEREG